MCFSYYNSTALSEKSRTSSKKLSARNQSIPVWNTWRARAPRDYPAQWADNNRFLLNLKAHPAKRPTRARAMRAILYMPLLKPWPLVRFASAGDRDSWRHHNNADCSQETLMVREHLLLLGIAREGLCLCTQVTSSSSFTVQSVESKSTKRFAFLVGRVSGAFCCFVVDLVVV